MHFFVFFGHFWAYVGQPHGRIGWAASMPFTSINSTYPRTNSWNFHKKILKMTESDNTVWSREDKTIESAVSFPAPEKGDNRRLSPFHPRMIIVVGECPLLSPVWKSFPLPRKPLKRLENLPPSPSPVTWAGTGKGTPSYNALKEPNFHYFINLTWPTFSAASTVQFAVVILLEKN